MNETRVDSNILKEYINKLLGFETSKSVTIILGLCDLLDTDESCITVIENAYLNDDIEKATKVNYIIANLKSNINIMYSNLGLSTTVEDSIDVSINEHAMILETITNLGDIDISTALFIQTILDDTSKDDITKVSDILYAINNDIKETTIHELFTYISPSLFKTLSTLVSNIMTTNEVVPSTSDIDNNLLLMEMKLTSDLKVIDINNIPKQIITLISDMDELHSYIINKQKNYAIMTKKLNIIKLDNNIQDYRNESMRMIMHYIIVESILDPIRYMDEVKLLIADLHIDLNIVNTINKIFVESNILSYLIGKYNAKY